MAITKPPVLPAWAESGDRVTPSNAEIQVGWPLSSIPPSRQRFNWLLNFLANGTRYFSRRGLPDYDAAETYMIGDRIIGDDGKTYRSLIDTNLAQTPSASPTKWERWALTLAEMYTSLTTPAQFDNSVKPATTAFVKSSGLQSSSFIAIAATSAIGLNAVGGTVLLNSVATPFTATLPAASTVPSGCRIEFMNVNTGVATVARAGADTIFVNNGVVTSFAIPQGDTLTLESNGVNSWYAVGGSMQLGFATGSFGSSLAANGYQKLPSGLIIQWGSGSLNYTTAIQIVTITFPIAFPNACRAVTVGNFGVMPSGTGHRLSVESFIAASFVAGYTSPIAQSGIYSWIAIGN